MELYRDRLWDSWTSTTKPLRTDIPVAKAQLLGRSTTFDGGKTLAWMTGLQEPTWRAVRDAHTGHSIHVVSDRSFDDLTADLDLGLRLLGWMSQKTAVTWYWWDHAWPRLLPAFVDPKQEHLNGGWAVPGVPEVHVYRREEAHKVLIHECIHALLLDVPEALVDPVLRQFEESFGRKLWPHLGEAFTELYAEFLWSLSRARNKKEAVAAWTSQIRCSEKQAAQVWIRIHDATEAETTNVFAYYVLKWVLMQHLDSALLAPAASVAYWFDWWLAALPLLEELASHQKSSESEELRMGMTCA
jgi:hypothetical protein